MTRDKRRRGARDEEQAGKRERERERERQRERERERTKVFFCSSFTQW